jgi:hypothetical protein
MDFSNVLFRCSSLGHIMTDPRSKSETLSETCKTHLIDVYVSNKYGRRTDVQNKYIEKGLMVEEDSITLYSRIKKSFFKKNEEHLHNDFIQGTPDLFTGLEITEADSITDVKSSWDIFTFFRVHTQSLNKMYYWQLQGYMDLSGASKSTLAYCLINTPAPLINDEKRRLLYKMGITDEFDSNYVEACAALEKNMIYDDIPISERLIEFTIERNEEDINKMHNRISDCRNYLSELEIKLNPVLLAEYKENDLITLVREG